MTKKTKNKTAKKTSRRGGKKTKKTSEIVDQIVALREARFNFNQISKQLNVTPGTAKKWYYETLDAPSKDELSKMRVQETNLNDEIIRRCKQDVANLSDPVQPDWDKYKSNAMARAKAYDSWLNAFDRNFEKKIKAYNTMVRASKNIIELNGLQAPTRVEIGEPGDFSSAGLDSEIQELMRQMDANHS